MTKFWMEDILVLIKSDNIFEIMPDKSFDSNRKLNSIMRFGIYYSIIAYAITRKEYVFSIPFIIMIVTIFIYNYNSNNNNNEINDSNDDKKDANLNCNKPTSNNPFMNLNMFDINETDKSACLYYDNNTIKQKINKIFNKGLYIDQSGIYSNNNSQNRFYTMPNTKPANDQKLFGEWLYKTGETCKEGNGIKCSDNLPERLNRILVNQATN